MSARRRIVASLALLVTLATAPSSATTSGAGGRAPVLARSFTVLAEGYPAEPAPGSQSQPISIRPAASRVSLANPPASAYARAAAADLGLAEGYFGQQGPSAEVDTAIEGQPHEASVDDDEGVRLHARVTEVPSAEASAEVVTAGVGTTASQSSGALTADGHLVADALSEIRDATIGPVAASGARFEAHASTTGRPGGGEGTGSVTLSGATVGGVPVIVDDTGVRVDDTAVPLTQVRTATAAIQRFMAQGGYSDVRVVQPTVTVADDGSRVEVSGGGVAVYLTNNDPSNLYFVSFRGLGGRALVAIGDEIGTVGSDRPMTPPAPPSAPAALPAPGETSDPATVAAPASPRAVPSEEPVELAYLDTRASAELRGIWPGWPWVLLGGVAVIAATLGALRTRRGRRLADLVLDGYVRG